MSLIAQAIADRQNEIERLQAEIKALSDVETLLGGAAPQAKPAPRRSSRPRKTAAAAPAAAPGAAAEGKSEAKPARKRRQMSPEEKKAVSERMTAYWAARRKKGAK